MISAHCLLARGQILVLRWFIQFGERNVLEALCLDHAKTVLEGSKTLSFEILWGYAFVSGMTSAVFLAEHRNQFLLQSCENWFV